MRKRMVGEVWEKNPEVREVLFSQNEEGKDTQEVEVKLVEFIDKHYGGEVILAGNSIHQDRKFVDREWKEISKLLHYRMLDVSAWKVWFEGAKGKKFAKQGAHRAMDDIQGSIEELKWYLKSIK